MHRTTLLAVGACALGLALPAAASAAVPVGDYYCRYLDDSTMGVIHVTGASSYRFNSAKSGTFKLRGSKITFVSGPMKGVYPRAVLARKSGLTLIQLSDKDFGHTATDANCILSKS
jgi:hypothetical protein